MKKFTSDVVIGLEIHVELDTKLNYFVDALKREVKNQTQGLVKFVLAIREASLY